MLNVIWPAYLLVNKHDQAEHTAHQYCSPQLKYGLLKCMQFDGYIILPKWQTSLLYMNFNTKEIYNIARKNTVISNMFIWLFLIKKQLGRED